MSYDPAQWDPFPNNDQRDAHGAFFKRVAPLVRDGAAKIEGAVAAYLSEDGQNFEIVGRWSEGAARESARLAVDIRRRLKLAGDTFWVNGGFVPFEPCPPGSHVVFERRP